MRIDLDHANVPWDETIVLRGYEIPLVAPRDVPDTTPLCTRGALGLAIRLWRRLVGKVLGVDLLHEYQSQCAAFMPPELHPVARRLTGAECLQVISVYTALQQQWLLKFAALANPEPGSLSASGGVGVSGGVADSGGVGQGSQLSGDVHINSQGRSMTRLAVGAHLPASLGGGFYGPQSANGSAAIMDEERKA